ncbi:hypothetical protein GCM10028822_32840 [Hymenobacter terrigena]
MKSILFLLSVCLFLLKTTVGYAQTAVIEVDSVTGVPSAVLPFDQPFILKIPTKSQQVFSVAYVQNAGRQSLATSIQRREPAAQKYLNNVNKYNKVLKLENLNGKNSDFEVKRVGTQNYLLIRIRGEHLLNPGKIYTFFWNEDVDDTVMKLFDQYVKYRNSGISHDLDIASATYKEVAIANRDVLGLDAGLPSDAASVKTLAPIKDAYEDTGSHNHLKENYNDLYKNVADYKSYVQPLTVNGLITSRGSLLILLQEISQRSPHFDTTLKTKYLPNVLIASKRILHLVDLDSARWHSVLLGYQTLDCINCKSTAPEHFETRFANLKTSTAGLEELLLVARAVQNNQPALRNAVIALTGLAVEMRGRVQSFEKIAETRKAIKDEISSIGLSDLHQVGGTTVVASFESRTKFSITPDFGLVTTRIGKDGGNPYALMPYLGFQVNLRPLNRDIPFWMYKHKPLHYASIMVGYTQVSIDNGPKKSPGADSVANFFNKSTLITGAGFRLGNAVRLTGGLVWYFQYNTSNPDVKPIVYDRRRLQTWPFVGVSVDLSLTTLLNGISEIIPGISRRFQPSASAKAATP